MIGLKSVKLALLTLAFPALACGSDPPANNPPPAPDAGSPDAGGADAGPIGPGPEQAGGTTAAVALADGRAYVLVGPRLVVWDVSHPAAPVRLGETAPFADVLNEVAVAGTTAFVVSRHDLDGDVYVVDVADASRPTQVGHFQLGTAADPIMPVGVAASGTTLYVAHEGIGLSVYDVTTASAPTLVKRVTNRGGGGRLRLVGTRLYGFGPGWTGGVAIGAVDTAADFADLGSFVVESASGADVGAGHFAIASGAGGTKIFDVTDLANPVTVLEDSQRSRVAVLGDQAAWVPGYGGLASYDLSTPGSAATVVAMATDGANAAAAAGGLLVEVTDRGQLLVIDTHTLAAPVLAATADASLCADCIGVTVSGGELYLGDGMGGLRTGHFPQLDAHGRFSPTGELDYEDVVVDGHVAYVADWFSGVRSFDVSDPGAPQQLGALATGGMPGAVALAGGKLYVGEATNAGALRVIDVSDPSHMVLLGSTPTSQTFDIAIQDHFAFVADGSNFAAGGLHIYDVANPAAITQVGAFEDGCDSAQGVAVSGQLAVVACSDAFHIVDVSDPAHPVGRGVWKQPDVAQPWAVAVSGQHAALGYDFGVAVVDLADPTIPKLLAQWPTSYTVRALSLPTLTRVVAACGSGGVYQWDVPADVP